MVDSQVLKTDAPVESRRRWRALSTWRSSLSCLLSVTNVITLPSSFRVRTIEIAKSQAIWDRLQLSIVFVVGYCSEGNFTLDGLCETCWGQKATGSNDPKGAKNSRDQPRTVRGQNC